MPGEQVEIVTNGGIRSPDPDALLAALQAALIGNTEGPAKPVALAEACGRNGSDLAASFAVGFEVLCKLARAMVSRAIGKIR